MICGIVSLSGPNGELLACGYKPDHGGNHSWSLLPTFTSPSRSDAQPPEDLTAEELNGWERCAQPVERFHEIMLDPPTLMKFVSMARRALAAEELVLSYGRHNEGCNGQFPDWPCKCGWRDARPELAAFQESQEEHHVRI